MGSLGYDVVLGILFLFSNHIAEEEMAGCQLELPRQIPWNQTRPRGYKTFFILNSAEHEIYPAHNVKMPTIVGILTFISVINKRPERPKARFFYLSVF